MEISKEKEIIDKGTPEHIPAVPYDVNKEKLKDNARKLAKELKRKSGKIEPVIVTSNNEVKRVSELNVQEQENEFIKCATNPIYFIETYLTIFDQTRGDVGEIIPFKLFDFQKELIETYVNDRFVIANKYRQAGVSTTTCAYIAWYVMFNRNRQVAIVADKLETARDELMNDVVEFIEGCPSWLRPKTGRSKDKNLKDTQKLKVFDNESKLGAFSSKGLRGYTPTLIFWDETAWTEKGDVFWTSAKPTLQTGGRAIMVSTPSGLDAVFYKTFNAARQDKDHPFTPVELWWFNDPRYNEGLEWIKHKDKENEIRINDDSFSNKERIKMMDDGWQATSPWFENEVSSANGDMRKIAQELLCSFLGSGDNFISEEYLQRIEDYEIKTPIRQEYSDKNMWIFNDPEAGEDYIMAIDASAGHGDDYSTINILKNIEIIEEKVITKNKKPKKIKIKKYKIEQVAEYYGKLTPQMLAEIAYQYGVRYNNAYCVIDITGGYGVQTVEKLIEFGYENVHYSEVNHKPSRDRLQGYIKKGQKRMGDGNIINVDLIPGFFIGNNRASVLLEMQRAIHLKDVIIKSVRLLNELKTFITVPGNRVADHKRTFHDDSIMGLAIGLFTINFDMSRYKQSKTNTKKMLDAFMTVNDIDRMKINKPNKPMIPKTESSLNPYGSHSWLFSGITDKNKK